jgi:S1-C subfamily serine protease
MTMALRVLRSHTRSERSDVPETSSSQATSNPKYQLKQQGTTPIAILPGVMTTQSTGLSRKALATLQLKRRKLSSSSSQTTTFIPALARRPTPSSATLTVAARATLVFAQHEAGTAVCISPSGLILTCAHCVADTAEEHAAGKSNWLLFSSGQVVRAKCVAWDSRRDLALLCITAADKTPESPSSTMTFPSATIALQPPLIPREKQATRLLCIGHPGSEDLEAPETTTVTATNYDVLHVSYGHYHGLASVQDVQDNSEIGALQHDCWTYWGHSGAPLIDAESGEVIGLHSSWDDETGMRRGVAWEALKAFLEEWCEEV